MRRGFSLSRRSTLVAFSLCLLVVVFLTVTVNLEAIRQAASDASLAFQNADDLSKLTPLEHSSSSSFDKVENLLNNEPQFDSRIISVEEGAELLWAQFDIEFLNLNRTYSMVVPTSSSSSRDDIDDHNNNNNGGGGASEGGEALARNTCGARPNSTKVLVVVPTRPDAFERRARIRESWAERNLTSSLGIVVRFLVGKSEDAIVSALLIDELRTVNDLIVNDIPDSYENLYLKMYSALQWQEAFCESARFIFKTDDDTVVDLERLAHWVDVEFAPLADVHPASIFGGIWHGTRPTRDKKHKWYVPKSVFHDRTFPDYANGPTYLLTTAAARALLDAAPRVSAFAIEDVLYTGVLAEAAGVRRVESFKFFRQGSKLYREEKCDEATNTIPYVTAFYSFTADQIPDAYRLVHAAKCSRVAATRRRAPVLHTRKSRSSAAATRRGESIVV